MTQEELTQIAQMVSGMMQRPANVQPVLPAHPAVKAVRADGRPVRPPVVRESATARQSLSEEDGCWVLRIPKIQPRLSEKGTSYVVGIADRLTSEDGVVKVTCCLYMPVTK